MGSVWKRLNRINKRASKFRFIASYQELCLEAGGREWQPMSLSVVWTRRGRRVVSEPVKWEPTMKSPYIGMCVWPVPDNQEITVTLFRDQRTEQYENKDWFFIVEDVFPSGKRKPVAQARINLQEFAHSLPTQQTIDVKLRPLTKKVKNAKLTLTLSGQFLREGKVTDDDMRSEASIISNSTLPPDIANLESLEEEEEEEMLTTMTALEFNQITEKMQKLSESLENSIQVQAGMMEVMEEQKIALSTEKVKKDIISEYSQNEQKHAKVEECKSNDRINNSPSHPFRDGVEKVRLEPELGNDDVSSTPQVRRIPATKQQQQQQQQQPAAKAEPITETQMISKVKSRKIANTTEDKLTEEIPPSASYKEKFISQKESITGEIYKDYDDGNDDKETVVHSTPKMFNSTTFDPVPSMRLPTHSSPQPSKNCDGTSKLKSLENVKGTVFSDTPKNNGNNGCMMSDEKEVENIAESPLILLLNKDKEESIENSIKKTKTCSDNSFLVETAEEKAIINRENKTQMFPTTAEKEVFPNPQKCALPSTQEENVTISDVAKKSTSSDLLEWSKLICSKYSIKITNFTTSWRNGLAFCSLIHHFYPDLIPYDTLTVHDIKYNCKLAFEAGERLGILRVIEPEDMVIKKIPDKLSVITYLHQLKSTLGKPETKDLLEQTKQDNFSPTVRKSFSESNIKFLSRTSSRESDTSLLPTVEEEAPQPDTVYRQKAKDLILGARADSTAEKVTPTSSSQTVTMRGRSGTPRRRDNRLSYIDNEMRYLEAEQTEIDKQAAILDTRLRETSDSDQLVYDALLQQWFILVNQKNALLRRQMQLNILEKENDLEKKYLLLQDELRTYSDMEDERKTEDDRRREELLLEELVLVVNQRNELVIQRDEEERMIEQDEQIEQEVTIPEDSLIRNKSDQPWFSQVNRFFSKK